MAVADQLSRATPYVHRLLADEYVQEQLREAVTGLRRGGKRAKQGKAQDTLKDRRLWSDLQNAASSLTAAVRALNEPEPPPTHHRLRNAALLAAVAGVGAYAWQQRSSDDQAG